MTNLLRAALLGAAFLFQTPALLAQDAVAGKPFLWRVDGAVPHYLFGTTHVADPRVTTLAKPVQDAIDRSAVLITEFAINDAALTAFARVASLPPEQKLGDLLSEQQRKHVTAELQRIHPTLSVATFERQKIWLLATSLPLLAEQLKSRGAPALDMKLAQDALAAGKRNEGLETVEEQAAVFDQMDLKQQHAYLDAVLREMQRARDAGEDPVQDLIRVYLQGDEKILADWLRTELVKTAKDLPGLGERLLADRNVRMADRLHARLKADPKTPLFVAVGAGHLVGDKNIVELLKAKGYKISRVH